MQIGSKLCQHPKHFLNFKTVLSATYQRGWLHWILGSHILAMTGLVVLSAEKLQKCGDQPEVVKQL